MSYVAVRDELPISTSPARESVPMRIPEPVFVFVNPVVRTLLRSPMHGVLSKSVMLITFTGKKSGRRYTTPVRYVRLGDVIRCQSSSGTRWWRNLRGGAEVTLRLQGVERRYWANAVEGDREKIREALKYQLAQFPQDAAYHNIRLNRDGSLVSEDLERAAKDAIVVEARPLG